MALLAASVLTSCLDAELDVELRDNGAVRMDIRYSVSNDLLLTGAPERTEEFWLLPLRRQDFQRMVDFTPGLTLRRYRSRARGETTEVFARLEADSVATANTVLAPGSGAGIRPGQAGNAPSLVVFQPLGAAGTSILAEAGADDITLSVRLSAPEGQVSGQWGLDELLSAQTEIVLSLSPNTGAGE